MQVGTKLVWKDNRGKTHQQLKNFQRNGFITSFEQERNQTGRDDLLLIYVIKLLPVRQTTKHSKAQFTLEIQ